MLDPEQLGAGFSIYEGQYADGTSFYEISGPGVNRYHFHRVKTNKFEAEELVRLLSGVFRAGKMEKAREVKMTLHKLMTEP